MAVLPPRLQRILYARLELYNCVSSQHPKQLQKYGGVAICSGGCYKSLCDWYYLEASLFKADLASTCSDFPLIFEVTGAPDCFLANGPYLKTTDVFNGHPVYAQLTLLELSKLENCIQNKDLLKLLKSKAQNLGDRDLRAGERLLVRQTNAWVLQSVSAYKGYSNRSGACGFHFLHFGHKGSTCFAGMDIRMKPMMQNCSAKVMTLTCDAHDFVAGTTFSFGFGSRRCVAPTVVKGITYKPRQTQNQAFHSDGPTEHDATSIWKECGSVNWKSDACRLSRLKTLTADELKACCLSRSIGANGTRQQLEDRLAKWLANQPTTPLPILDSMFQSLSALFAFYPNTALGVPCYSEQSPGSWSSLKLSIPIGTAVLFRFDFFHHGWKCVDDDDKDTLPVHFRAHFYLFSGFLPALPVVNFEATLEFLSVLSHDDVDDATLLLLLECLQTFVPYAKPFDLNDHSLKPVSNLTKCRQYQVFASQLDLDHHCEEIAGRCQRVFVANGGPA